MLDVPELERLSRFADGELGPADAAAVERELCARPELRTALEQLRSIGAAARELPATLNAEHAERLVRGAMDRPVRAQPAGLRSRGWWVAVAAAFSGAVLGGGWALSRAHHPTELVVTSPAVVRDGQPVHGRAALKAGEGISTGATGSAWVTSGDLGLLVARNSRVELSSGGVHLVSGAALVSGQGEVQAGQHQVHLEGRVAVSMEPGDALGRVTSLLGDEQNGDDLMRWKQLGPAAAAVGLAGGVALYVFEGHAEVRGAKADENVVVRQGQAWNSGDRAPKNLAPAQTESALAVASAASASPVAAKSAASTDPLAKLSHQQLLDEAIRLRSERDLLLAQRAGPAKATADEHTDLNPNGVPRTFYRFSQQQLEEMADRGTLAVRPALSGNAPSFPAEAKQAVGLTADEQQGLQDIYRRSGERIAAGLREIYERMGGDRNVAGNLSVDSLIGEIRAKSRPSEGEGETLNAIALERAGRVPAKGPFDGAPTDQMYRLMWHEEDRVFDEVDALLGSARAEQLLSASGVGGTLWSTSSSAH